MASVFWLVFLASFIVFWKLFSDYAPLQEFSGVDIRVMNIVASLTAAFGVAFTAYVVSQALGKQEEEKKTDFGDKPRKKEPGFDELYQPRVK